MGVAGIGAVASTGGSATAGDVSCTDLPQDMQNFAPSVTCAPQYMQYLIMHSISPLRSDTTITAHTGCGRRANDAATRGTASKGPAGQAQMAQKSQQYNGTAPQGPDHQAVSDHKPQQHEGTASKGSVGTAQPDHMMQCHRESAAEGSEGSAGCAGRDRSVSGAASTPRRRCRRTPRRRRTRARHRPASHRRPRRRSRTPR